MPKDKGLVEKGPGDVSSSVETSSWRGDSGTSDAKGSEETSSVDGYSR